MLSFYGVSVAELSLLTMTRKRRRTLVKLINSGDPTRIRNTREQAIYLLEFLNNIPKVYDDVEVKSLESRLRRLRKGNTKVSAFSSVVGTEQTEESIQMQIDEVIRSKGLVAEVANSFVDIDSNKRMLSPEAFEIFKRLSKDFPDKLDQIQSSCVEGSITEKRIFGRTPTSVFVKPYLMEDGFRKYLEAMGSKRTPPFEVIRRLQKEMEEVESVIDLTQSATEDGFVAVTSKELEGMLATRKFLEYATLNGLPPEEVEELEHLYLKFIGETNKTFKRLLDRESVNYDEMEELCYFYFTLFLLDHSKTFLNGVLGTDNIALNEIDRIYEELNTIGFFYFNRSNVKLFLNELKTLVIGKDQSSASLDIKSGVDGRDFIDVYQELKMAMLSLSPSGSVREVNIFDTVSI